VPHSCDVFVFVARVGNEKASSGSGSNRVQWFPPFVRKNEGWGIHFWFDHQKSWVPHSHSTLSESVECECDGRLFTDGIQLSILERKPLAAPDDGIASESGEPDAHKDDVAQRQQPQAGQSLRIGQDPRADKKGQSKP
jgi:hypothetical protein